MDATPNDVTALKAEHVIHQSVKDNS